MSAALSVCPIWLIKAKSGFGPLDVLGTFDVFFFFTIPVGAFAGCSSSLPIVRGEFDLNLFRVHIESISECSCVGSFIDDGGGAGRWSAAELNPNGRFKLLVREAENPSTEGVASMSLYRVAPCAVGSWEWIPVACVRVEAGSIRSLSRG